MRAPGRALDVGPSTCVGAREHTLCKALHILVQAFNPEVPLDDIISHNVRHDGPQRKILMHAELHTIPLTGEAKQVGVAYVNIKRMYVLYTTNLTRTGSWDESTGRSSARVTFA